MKKVCAGFGLLLIFLSACHLMPREMEIRQSTPLTWNAEREAFHLTEAVCAREPERIDSNGRGILFLPGIYNPVASDTDYIYYESPQPVKVLKYPKGAEIDAIAESSDGLGGLVFSKTAPYSESPMGYIRTAETENGLVFDFRGHAAFSSHNSYWGKPYPDGALTPLYAFAPTLVDSLKLYGLVFPRPLNQGWALNRQIPVAPSDLYCFLKAMPDPRHTFVFNIRVLTVARNGMESDTHRVDRVMQLVYKKHLRSSEKVLRIQDEPRTFLGLPCSAYDLNMRTTYPDGIWGTMYFRGYLFPSPTESDIIFWIEYSERAPFNLLVSRPNASAAEDYIRSIRHFSCH